MTLNVFLYRLLLSCVYTNPILQPWQKLWQNFTAEHITRPFDSYSVIFSINFKAGVLVAPSLSLVVVHLNAFLWVIVDNFWVAFTFKGVGLGRNYRLASCKL